MVTKFQPVRPHKFALRGAAGNTFYPIGKSHVWIKIGTYSVRVPVLVLDHFQKPILLGLNFLKTNKAIIDLRANTVVLGRRRQQVIIQLGSSKSTQQMVKQSLDHGSDAKKVVIKANVVDTTIDRKSVV